MSRRLPLLALLITSSNALGGVWIGHPLVHLPTPTATEPIVVELLVGRVQGKYCGGGDTTLAGLQQVDALADDTLQLPTGTFCGLFLPEGANLQLVVEQESGSLTADITLPPVTIALPRAITVNAQAPAAELWLLAPGWLEELVPGGQLQGEQVVQPGSPEEQALVQALTNDIELRL